MNTTDSEQFKFLIHTTIRKGDHVNEAEVVNAIKAAGGVQTAQGFGFQTQVTRDQAVAAVASRFGDGYVAGADDLGPGSIK